MAVTLSVAKKPAILLQKYLKYQLICIINDDLRCNGNGNGSLRFRGNDARTSLLNNVSKRIKLTNERMGSVL